MIKEYLEITKKQIKKYYILIIVGILYLLFFKLFLPHRSNCIFKNITGLPCPGCGLTRSFLSLFKFDIKSAFYYHPLFWLIIIIGFVVFYSERPRLGKIAKSKWFWIIIAILFTVVYIIRFKYVFPSPPMDYDPDNLINKFFR